MGVVWGKVRRDLAHNKARTAVVVLSTAVGIFALGMVFGLSGVMRERMTEDALASLPGHINFWGGPFDDDVVEAVLREPGVLDVERQVWGAPFRWKLEGETEWRDGALYAREDYEAQRMDLIDLVDGHWPAGRALAVERQSADYFGIPLGTTLVVEYGHSERRIAVGGVLRVPTSYPPQFGGKASFYAMPETVAWLAGREGFDDLYVRMESFSQEGAEELAERVRSRLEGMGLTVGGPWIRDPGVHFMQDQVDALFVILGVLGGLALGLSVFLIVNTTSAIMAQQVWQVGVMKVCGATFRRVVGVYLTTVLAYGILATWLAVPLGALAAHFLAGLLLGLMSIDIGSFRVVPSAVAVQAAVGLSVPVLAALVPVIGGARITPHQAIGTYGLGGGFGQGLLDRLVSRVRRLPRPLALSLRNTFRRKARLVLTLLTLTLGGVMFIMVLSVGGSFDNTIEVLLDDFGHDVLVGFESRYHISRLLEATEAVPGVAAAEVWDIQNAALLLDGEERQVRLWGFPSGSAMFDPSIVAGRGLVPGDGRAILLNSKIAADEGIEVGDEITVRVGERESAWTVVGLVRNINNGFRDNFVPFAALAQETGGANRGWLVAVQAEQPGLESQQRLVNALRDVYDASQLQVSFFESAEEVKQQNRAQFDILTTLMLSMSILAAVVGSLGLMGTMSINVVERGREIGVMRSTGATSFIVAGVFVSEGILIGLLSWLLAVPLSYPGARSFSHLVGETLMKLPLDFRYPASSVVLWLVIVVVFSALASLWPALRATRVSVREALAYE